MAGAVLRVDRFGNLVTNIPRAMVERLAQRGARSDRRRDRRRWTPGGDVCRGARPARSARSSAAPITWRSPTNGRRRRAARLGLAVAARRVEVVRLLGRCARLEVITMDFSFTEEQRLLEQSVREWGAREIAPRIKDLDRQHRFDPDILPQMAGLGLLGISVPAKYGGAGMDYISLGLASEELEYVDTSLRVIMSVHAGLNCLTPARVGHRGAEAAVPGAAGARRQDRHVRPHRAGGGQRRPRHPVGGREAGRSLRPDRREDVDFARGRRRPLPRLRLERPREEEAARPVRAHGVPRGARVQGFLERHPQGEVGHPRREHRLLQDGRDGGARGERPRAAWRGIQDRDVRARPGPVHRGGRGDGPHPGLPRRQREVREGAAGVRRRDRPAPAGEGDDRRDGIRLPGVAAALAEGGLAEERRRRTTRETSLAKWYATVASERAAGDAVQVHGANGYSDDYPAGRFYRNCKGAVIYEGTREVHTLMQADYVLGYRVDRPTRCELPPFTGDREA